MELVVLNWESVKVVCRGAAAVHIFFFSHPDYDNGEFYAAKKNINVAQEGVKEYPFDVPVTSVICSRQSVSARVNKERVEDKNITVDLPSISLGQRGNLNDDDMNKLQEQRFDVD